MKIIIIGTSLSGKTTLLQHLKSNTELPLSEIDDELTKLNGGTYPVDSDLKHKKLAPQVIQEVLAREKVIFFTNTDYFTEEDLKKAKERGFKIVQLNLSLGILMKRNKNRVEKEGYQDMSEWLKGMVAYQEKIEELGLVDHVLDGNQSTEKITQELQVLIE